MSDPGRDDPARDALDLSAWTAPPPPRDLADRVLDAVAGAATAPRSHPVEPLAGHASGGRTPRGRRRGRLAPSPRP